MPQDERFLDRAAWNHVLYGVVMGLQRALPSVTDERAVMIFLEMFPELPGDPTPDALRHRLIRMKTEYHYMLRTPKTAQGAEELPRQ